MSKNRSPSALTAELFKNEGYIVETVERFIPGVRIRKDLLGFIDQLAFKDNEVVAIQSTSWSNISSRINKIIVSEHLPLVRKLGWKILVLGWKKNNEGNYVYKTEDIS